MFNKLLCLFYLKITLITDESRPTVNPQSPSNCCNQQGWGKKELVLGQILQIYTSVFFCSLLQLHPSPTITTHHHSLLPILNRQTVLGVTAGLTCRASGGSSLANGLISCWRGVHPISPESHSLSTLSSPN